MNDTHLPPVVHIITVGTSVLTNCGWKVGQAPPSKAELSRRLRDGDPRKLSAELNALIPFLDRGECDRVHLLTTDTVEGRLCRDCLAVWLQSRGVHITGAEARGLLPRSLQQTNDQHEFNRAIRAFRQVLFRAVQRARKRGDRVLLNATGGLKAEIIVAVLIAAELGVPAYYLHQSMPQPVFLPISPVDADLRAWLQSNADKPFVRPGKTSIDFDRLEYEGLVKISRRSDGVLSQVRFTDYGRYWANQTYIRSYPSTTE